MKRKKNFGLEFCQPQKVKKRQKKGRGKNKKKSSISTRAARTQ